MSAWTEDKRREEMLRELELLPVWRLRDAAPVVQAAPAEQATAEQTTAEQATLEQATLEPATALAHSSAEIAAPQTEAGLNTADITPPAAVSENNTAAEQSSAPAAWTIDRADDAAPEVWPAEALSPAVVLEVAEPELLPLAQHAQPPITQDIATQQIATPDDETRPHEDSPAAIRPAEITMQASTVQAGDDHADEREYYAASPTAWMEYAESVEPDWYSQEELAAATPDRRAQIMGMAWQALQQSVPGCQACQLHSTRTQTVFGVGDPQAEWLFVGEAPGAEEDKRGEPFVGQAGKLLDNMLAAIQLKRGENVYIANVLKCRPPANRDPQGEEVQQCEPYLKRQVELIQPKLIVALGKFAAQSLLQSQGSIASLRGGLHDFHGVPVIVTYHPAYLLRNLPDKARAWEDLCLARETMRGLQSQQATPSSV